MGKVNFGQHLIEATRQVFETLVCLPLTPGEPVAEGPVCFDQSVSGLLGLSGDLKGLLCIHCPDPVALSITTMLLGCEGSQEDMQDAMGEIANMVAGYLKTAIAGAGKKVELSIPTFISGAAYTLAAQNDGERIAIPFQVPGGRFLVELHYQWAA